jgi:hypothetical protein
MQSTQWTIHDLSRTDHNQHSACEYKRLHKYGEKFNASIQIMVKRLTLKTVILLFLTIIHYNTWSVYTQLILHTVSLRSYISQSCTRIIIRLVQKQWAKGKKCILCYTLYFDIPGLKVLKKNKMQKHKRIHKKIPKKKKKSLQTYVQHND